MSMHVFAILSTHLNIVLSEFLHLFKAELILFYLNLEFSLLLRSGELLNLCLNVGESFLFLRRFLRIHRQ